MLKRNTSGLNKHAQNKRNLAFERTELAIQKLLKDKKDINFGTIAQEAGVSRTWLYNQREIRERIKKLRYQDKFQDSKIMQSQSNKHNPVASKSSKSFEQTNLQQLIKKLETENGVLRQHLEVVYGMSDSQLVKTVEELQINNAELKRQLLELSSNQDNQSISDQVSRQLQEKIYSLEIEKAKLLLQNKELTLELQKNEHQINELDNLKMVNQKQANEIQLLSEQLEFMSQKLANNLVLESNNQPLTSDNKEIKNQLCQLGLKLNSTLLQLVDSKPKEQVLNAISIVKKAIASGHTRSKLRLFKQALEFQ